MRKGALLGCVGLALVLALLGCATKGGASAGTSAAPTSDIWIMVALKEGAAPADVEALRVSVAALPGVESVSYRSADQALKEFREIYKSLPDIVNLNRLHRPSGDALEVFLRDPSGTGNVMRAIARDPNLAKVIADPKTPLGSMSDIRDFAHPVTVFIKDGAAPADVEALLASLRRMDGVRSVSFISKAEALQRFTELTSRTPELTKQLRGNPLPDSIQLTLTDPRQVRSVVDDILKDPHLRAVIKNPANPLAEDVRYVKYVPYFPYLGQPALQAKSGSR
jgi:cell division protein FtsX